MLVPSFFSLVLGSYMWLLCAHICWTPPSNLIKCQKCRVWDLGLGERWSWWPTAHIKEAFQLNSYSIQWAFLADLQMKQHNSFADSSGKECERLLVWAVDGLAGVLLGNHTDGGTRPAQNPRAVLWGQHIGQLSWAGGQTHIPWYLFLDFLLHDQSLDEASLVWEFSETPYTEIWILS